MLEEVKDICKCCNQPRYIQNKTKWWCGECVYKASHGGKTQAEVMYEKQKAKPYKAPKPIPIRKKPKIYVPKTTGEKQMFAEIWEERPHVCINCKCSLGNVPLTHFFSHRVAKGVDGSKRLDKDNIDLLCWDCHDCRDKQGKEAYDKRTNLYAKEFD